MKTTFSEHGQHYTITLTDPDERVPIVTVHFELDTGEVYFKTTKSGKLDAIAMTRLQTLISIGVTFLGLVNNAITKNLIPPDGFGAFWQQIQEGRDDDRH